jgi:hypothetical protein
MRARASVLMSCSPKGARRPCRRFEADLANQCSQTGFTHASLADGSGAEVLTWINGCSRYLLRLSAHVRVNGKVVLEEVPRC